MKEVIRFQNSNGFQTSASKFPLISLSWFSFSLSNGFWLSVLLVSRVSKSTFR
ncbi:hypothetical protein Hanom_Chr02g00098841 [Helianthus anomalus]